MVILGMVEFFVGYFFTMGCKHGRAGGGGRGAAAPLTTWTATPGSSSLVYYVLRPKYSFIYEIVEERK